jgi:hypothetical protein
VIRKEEIKGRNEVKRVEEWKERTEQGRREEKRNYRKFFED